MTGAASLRNGLAHRDVGRTRLSVTEIGVGGSRLGNLHEPVSEADAAATIAAGWSEGIRYFDTAPFYGNGLGEHRVGRALRAFPREAYVLSTKVGRLLRPDPAAAVSDNRLPFRVVHDYGYDATIRSLDDSLQRLGVASIDIAFIHDVDPYSHGREAERVFGEALGGAYRALHRLRAEGVLGAIGVGTNDWRTCLAAAEAGDFDCFLLAGGYTLLEQGALERLLPLCAERGISVMLGAPFNGGVLTRVAEALPAGRYPNASPGAEHRFHRIVAVCARHAVTLPAAALQFPLAHHAVCCVLPGPRRAADIDRLFEWRRLPIPAAFWSELKTTGLLPEAAPTPS